MPWVPVALWHGTLPEASELATAIEHNCPARGSGAGCKGCGAHELMLGQRTLDGLLWARYLLPRLKREEWRRRR